MGPTTASALRRASFTTLTLAITGAAHAATGGDVHLTALAPFIWLNVFAACFLVGRVTGPGEYRTWGPVRTLGGLVGGQFLAHLALGAAPWLLGLSQHHHAAGMTGHAMAVHTAAAGLIAVILWFGDRALARTVRIIGMVIGAGRTRPRPPRATRTLLAARRTMVPARRFDRTAPARGPPAPAAAAA